MDDKQTGNQEREPLENAEGISLKSPYNNKGMMTLPFGFVCPQVASIVGGGESTISFPPPFRRHQLRSKIAMPDLSEIELPATANYNRRG